MGVSPPELLLLSFSSDVDPGEDDDTGLPVEFNPKDELSRACCCCCCCWCSCRNRSCGEVAFRWAMAAAAKGDEARAADAAAAAAALIGEEVA